MIMKDLAMNDYNRAMRSAKRRINAPQDDVEYLLAASILATYTSMNKNGDPLGEARNHINMYMADESWHRKLDRFALSFFRELGRNDLIERYGLDVK